MNARPVKPELLPRVPEGATLDAEYGTVVHYPCQDCDGSMVFSEQDGELSCETFWCAAAGMTVPLWLAERRRAHAVGEPDATPSGLPRPRDAGLPIPWITPVAAGRAWFRLLHGERLMACQTGWRCQVCGDPLRATGWVLTNDAGAVSTSAAMHQQCLRLAVRWCPHLRSTRHHAVEATRDSIIADGVPLPQAPTDLEFRQTWTLTP